MASVTKSHVAAARRRRAEAIERVLAAVESMLEDGERFTELPVGRIAAESGIPRSTFYQYFPNKSQVLIHVAALASETFFSAPLSWFNDPESPARGVDGVEEAIGTMLREYRSHWTVMRALDELSSYDPEVAEFWIGRINEYISMMGGIVAGWQKAGAIGSQVDPYGATTGLVWMVERAISQHVLRPTGDVAVSDEQLVTSLSRIIWLTYYDDHSRNRGGST